MSAAARRDRPHRERSGGADVREHDRGAGAHRPHARPRRRRSTASTARRSTTTPCRRSSARCRRNSPRSATRSRRTPKLFERIARVYDTRETAGLTPEQQRLTWLYYTNFVRAGAKLDADGEEAPLRDQPGARHAVHAVRPERAQGRERAGRDDREGGRPGRPVAGGARRPGAGGRSPRPEGQVGRRQHALERRAVPDVLREPRAAREGLAHVRHARRQRRSDRQQLDDHAHPAAACRAREAARLPDSRALAARELDGEDARSARWN